MLTTTVGLDFLIFLCVFASIGMVASLHAVLKICDSMVSKKEEYRQAHRYRTTGAGRPTGEAEAKAMKEWLDRKREEKESR